MIFRDCPTLIETVPAVIDTIEGEFFKIKCRAVNYQVDPYNNWKKCKWERLRDKSYCRFDYRKSSGEANYEVTDKCLGLEDHYFFGDDRLFKGKGNPYCGMNINPTSIYDESDWRCSLVFEDPKNGSVLCTANTIIPAEVIVI